MGQQEYHSLARPCVGWRACRQRVPRGAVPAAVVVASGPGARISASGIRVMLAPAGRIPPRAVCHRPRTRVRDGGGGRPAAATGERRKPGAAASAAHGPSWALPGASHGATSRRRSRAASWPHRGPGTSWTETAFITRGEYEVMRAHLDPFESLALPDPGVGVRAAQRLGVQHARQRDVVGAAPASLAGLAPVLWGPAAVSGYPDGSIPNHCRCRTVPVRPGGPCA